MPSGRRRRRAALIAIAAAVDGSAVLAEHTAEERITDRSAYTARARTLRVGLTQIRYAPIERVSVGTSIMQWGLVQAPNLDAKVEVFRGDVVSLAAGAGASYVDTDWLFWFDVGDDARARLLVAPTDLFVSVRASRRWSFHNGLEMTFVHVAGSYDPEDVAGALATTNLQLVTNVELRVLKTMAVLLTGRYMVFQTLGGNANFRLQADPATTVSGRASATSDALDFPQAFAIVPSVHLSYGRFNVRYGIGYGNYVVPGINFTLPRRGPIPVLEAWWNFSL